MTPTWCSPERDIEGERTVQMTLYKNPNDADVMECFEYVGYRVPKGEARARYPLASTFDRSGIPIKGK